mmetsp:Transcript_17879/g.39647  ORF Transcript_17879/g.39647 Transcript_17879/m.39647 type:complete len:89 (-) Transcript_17879:30-296(-)
MMMRNCRRCFHYYLITLIRLMSAYRDGGGGGGAYVRSGVAGNAVDVQNEANAIPLMPTNLVGMAKEATVSAAAASSVETGRVAVKKDL